MAVSSEKADVVLHDEEPKSTVEQTNDVSDCTLPNELPEKSSIDASEDVTCTESMKSSSEEDEEMNVRLYLPGLASTTTRGSIEESFAKYNAVDVILKDRGDNRFAFITVSQRDAQVILAETPHEIDGVNIYIERTRVPLRSKAHKLQNAVAPPSEVIAALETKLKIAEGTEDNSKPAGPRKLFLGGLASTTTTADLKV